jgi:hypothetical protein
MDKKVIESMLQFIFALPRFFEDAEEKEELGDCAPKYRAFELMRDYYLLRCASAARYSNDKVKDGYWQELRLLQNRIYALKNEYGLWPFIEAMPDLVSFAKTVEGNKVFQILCQGPEVK